MKWSAEDKLTAECFRAITLKWPDLLVYHVANERNTKSIKTKRGYITPEGSKLKKMGVMKGVSDFIIDKMAHGYGGLRIELKTRKISGIDSKTGGPKFTRSFPKPEQKEYLLRCHQEGYAVNVCWTVEEVIDTIESYLDGSFMPCDYVRERILEVV